VCAGARDHSAAQSWPGFHIPWCDSGHLGYGDFDGDGKTDLICNSDDGKHLVALSKFSQNNGSWSGSFDPKTWWPSPPGGGTGWCDPAHLGYGDFDGNGKTDLICNSDDGKHLVAFSRGDGSFAAPLPWWPSPPGDGMGWCNLADLGHSGDFDGDGKTDLICNSRDGKHLVALSKFSQSNGSWSGSFDSKTWWPSPPGGGTGWCNPADLGYGGDFDGDRKTDLICNSHDQKHLIAFSNGNGAFTSSPTGWWPNSGPGWCNPADLGHGGDFDGDGKTDLICNSRDGKHLVALSKFSQSNGSWSGSFDPKTWWPSPPGGGPGWCNPADLGHGGDFDGDRKTDLICNSKDGEHLIAFSNGDGSFTPSSWWPAIYTVPPMSTARTEHTATLMRSGQVLVAGGSTNPSAEIYNPATNSWSPARNLTTPRSAHTATLLLSGQMLVVGGIGVGNSPLSSAELYDPATNSWLPAGNLTTPRSAHTATLLLSGQVLVAGGSTDPRAEIYDPSTNAWSPAGKLITPRYAHTATLLPSGQVLVAGGSGAAGGLASTELYDPATNSWLPAGNLTTPRYAHTATLLGGQVIVAGGWWSPPAGNPTPLPTTEVYDPATNAWRLSGPLTTGRSSQTATLLPSGEVLVVGGIGVGNSPLSSAELYNAGSDIWSLVGDLATPRWYHTATLLPSGQVLITGGNTGRTPTATAELARGAAAVD
jgi:hypothetical protein